jgi:hypothetical protein
MMEENLIDYAYPMLMAERKLKEAHSALLERNYDAGIERLLEAATEAKIAVNSVRHMKEQRNGICQ